MTPIMTNEEYARLMRSTDPYDLQRPFGLMRACELQALARIAQSISADAYVSLGCGAGWDFRALDVLGLPIRSLGFDCTDALDENTNADVEFHKLSIFDPLGLRLSDEVEVILSDFLGRCRMGPVLFYTDNGHKLTELRDLVPFTEIGDVLGTHDWGDGPITRAGTATEVPESECGFLYEAGFELLRTPEPWLETHRAIQRFWLRVRD